MNKWFCGILSVIVLFCGCYSVPHVDNGYIVSEGKYEIVIDTDYLGNAEELKYAMNSFVKEQGELSYDFEKQGRNFYIINTPGSQPVENLPKVKHFHKGRTIGLVVGVGGGVTLGALSILFYALSVSSFNKFVSF